MARVWQVGGGDAGRDYTQLCLDHDLILLGPGRYGPYTPERFAGAVALGIVADDQYRHNPEFDGVYRWDLQHIRTVIWQEHLQPELQDLQAARGPLFPSHRMPKFTGGQSSDVLRRIEPLVTRCAPRSVKPRPNLPPEPLTLEQVGEALFSLGLANSTVD